MIKQLALKIPGFDEIEPPGNMPDKGTETLQQVIPNVIIILIIVSIILTLVFILWGGIQWTTSQGNKEALQKARQKITFAIIGLVVVLLAFFIISFVGNLFGTSQLSGFTCDQSTVGQSCPGGGTCQAGGTPLSKTYDCR
ncbi:MAG: pilin [Patescibacteria group bacterium]|nr:pilin [Patescibacteria group bacterium]